jgi:hypothetical protein
MKRIFDALNAFLVCALLCTLLAAVFLHGVLYQARAVREARETGRRAVQLHSRPLDAPSR